MDKLPFVKTNIVESNFIEIQFLFRAGVFNLFKSRANLLSSYNPPGRSQNMPWVLLNIIIETEVVRRVMGISGSLIWS